MIAGNTTAEFWATLSRELRGRQPEFVREKWLEKGTLVYHIDMLPTVFVAPDVFDKLAAELDERGRIRADSDAASGLLAPKH